MALPAYTNDFTTIATGDLNFDLGTWDESTNAGWDTEGAMVDDEDLWYVDTLINTGEATSSCVAAQYTKDGTGAGTSGPGTIMYEHNASFTVPTDGVVSVHNYWAAPSALNPYAGTFLTAEAGVSVLLGTTLGDFDVHYVAGSDLYPAIDRNYATYFVDPTVTPAGTVGTVTTTNMVGIAIAAGPQARGNPCAVQAVRYGRGTVEYTLGELATPAKFSGYALIDNVLADKFNLLQDIEGGYKSRGLMSFGTTATAVYFDDSDVNISLANDLKVGPNFNRIEMHNAASVINWNNISMAALGIVSIGQLEMVDNCSHNDTGGVFTDSGTFIYQSNATIIGRTYRTSGLVTQGGATFTSVTFDKPSGTVGLLVDNLNLVTKSKFNSDGTGHGVNLGTIAINTSITWDNTDTDYTDASLGNETILVSVDTGVTLTINVTATATTPSVYNTGLGTVNVVAGQKTLSFTVTDSADIPLTGYEWRIYESDASIGIIGLVELAGEEVAVSSSQSYSYSYSTDKPVVIQVMNQPLNEESLTEATLLNSDQNFTIKLNKQGNI